MPFTKLYLSAGSAPYTPATIRGAWDDSAGAVTRALDQYPGNESATSVTRAETNAANEYDVLLYRGVSGPLAAQTISGTINVLIGCGENSASANLHWHLHVYVTQGNSDTPRGTLLTDYREAAGVNEWSNSGFDTGRALNAAQTLSALAISAGDRLVVEIGYAARNTVTTNFTGTLHYGVHRDNPDMVAGDNFATIPLKNGFIVFSNAITEETRTGRVTQLAIETATLDTNIARVTQLVVETLTPLPVPGHVTQLVVETLTPRVPVVDGTDYWTGGVDGLGVQGSFPPERTMIMAPSVGTNLSRNKAVAILAGTLLNAVAYPLANLTDGSTQTACRFLTRYASLVVDLGGAFVPTFASILAQNHDDDALWAIKGSNDSGMAAVEVEAVVASRTPHIWLDLRGFSFPACRYWNFVAVSTRPLTIGELVVGTAYLFEGIVDPDHEAETRFYGSREETEHGIIPFCPSGAFSRELRMGVLIGSADQLLLEAVFDDAGATGERVFVAPSTRKPECFWIDSIARREKQIDKSLLEARMTLGMREETPGIVV